MTKRSNKYDEFKTLFCSGLAGNGSDFAKFLLMVSPLIQRIVGKNIPPSDVDDVVQEVLISIHKARHTYDGERSILPWLISIARFRINDHLRKHYSQMRHQTIDIDELENILIDVTNDTQNNESISELLDCISDKHKQILTMMHVDGYTAKEVGTQLDMNESAVKVALHRAIKKIREKFGIEPAN